MKKKKEEKESSRILSKVQQNRQPGDRNTVIHSRVIHGDAAVSGDEPVKTTRKQSTSTRRAPTRTRAKRTVKPTTSTET